MLFPRSSVGSMMSSGFTYQLTSPFTTNSVQQVMKWPEYDILPLPSHQQEVIQLTTDLLQLAPEVC